MPRVNLFEPVWETGAYKWLNIVNGKVYVGGAYKDFKVRKREHLLALREGRHFNKHLQNAWNKYGEESFEFIIIERCSPEGVKDAEQRWLIFHGAGNGDRCYNIQKVPFSNLGVTWDEEARTRMSVSAKVRAARPEERARLVEQSKKALEDEKVLAMLRVARLGVPHTPEARAKISAASTGRVMTAETKEKLRVVNTGKKMSPEACAKISEVQKGKKATPETKAKMSAAHKARCARPEVREKMKGRKASQETKDKMAEAQRKAWQDEEQRKVRIDSMKGKIRSEEARRHMSEVRIGKKLPVHQVEALRAAKKDPAFRERLKESLRRSWADPLKRAERLRKYDATRKSRS